MMRKLDNNLSDLDLKCDFPARESFREALLERLLAMDEQGAHEPIPIEGAELPKDDLEARELSDSELDMLAAAQGHMYARESWPWEKQ